jgi:enoyl-CoA hydratase
VTEPGATVRIDRQTAVAVVTIDRPDVRNAVDRPTADALHDAFVQLDGDDSVLAVVLTGAGGTFCAGADLKAVSDGRGNRVVADLSERGPMGPTRLRMTKPVIAAIEGHAVAGGLELAVWCDLRVAARNATLGVYCRRWGVPLVDGGTFRLGRLIGQSRAMDLILTGRGIDGVEAERIGLVNRVVESGEARLSAVALAKELAAFPQRCLRSDRASLLDQWSMTEDEALLHEVELGLATIRSGETREGAQRFADGRGRGGSFVDL